MCDNDKDDKLKQEIDQALRDNEWLINEHWLSRFPNNNDFCCRERFKFQD